MSASVLAALCGWFATATEPAPTLFAGGEDSLPDSDGDFLPDVVEWAVLTNSADADTDGDLCPDFVEVVQRGSPRHPGVSVPHDHEMRVVFTGPATANDPTYLHLFFRFFGSPSLVSSFATWLEVPGYPGLQIPLNVLGFANVEMRDRQTANDGYWMHIAVPMVSEAMLRNFLPCSIRACATIGGNQVTTGVRLIDVDGVTSSLVPFGDGRYVLQSIGELPVSLPLSNRVCLLTLEATPGGTLYEIVDADCEDCNELECGPSCHASEGWFISVPGGLQNL